MQDLKITQQTAELELELNQTLYLNLYIRGVKLIFTEGHISLVVAFKGPK